MCHYIILGKIIVKCSNSLLSTAWDIQPTSLLRNHSWRSCVHIASSLTAGAIPCPNDSGKNAYLSTTASSSLYCCTSVRHHSRHTLDMHGLRRSNNTISVFLHKGHTFCFMVYGIGDRLREKQSKTNQIVHGKDQISREISLGERCWYRKAWGSCPPDATTMCRSQVEEWSWCYSEHCFDRWVGEGIEFTSQFSCLRNFDVWTDKYVNRMSHSTLGCVNSLMW